MAAGRFMGQGVCSLDSSPFILMVTWWNRKQEADEWGWPFSSPASSDPLSLPSLQLLKFPRPSRAVSTSQGPTVQTRVPMGNVSCSNQDSPQA